MGVLAFRCFPERRIKYIFLACRTSVKRVVVTSSTAGIIQVVPTSLLLDELDWND